MFGPRFLFSSIPDKPSFVSDYRPAIDFSRSAALVARLFLVIMLLASAALAQRPRLVSINQAGTGSGNNDSGDFGGYDISADGRYVTFASEASNLVVNDTNSTDDVFVRDLRTGMTTLVSVNFAGTGSSGARFHRISGNGRYVLFMSTATNLTSLPDTNLSSDVFVRDLLTGTTALVSINSAGTAACQGGAEMRAISADGRFVVFESYSNNLTPIPHGPNLPTDVYLRDMVLGTTTMISNNMTGTVGGNNSSTGYDVSADGRYVVFESRASDLTPNDNNGLSGYDIFRRDVQTGTTSLVSINRLGTATANNESRYAQMTPDGRFVAFSSIATDVLAVTDTNSAADLFIRDMHTNTTELISVSLAGTETGNRISNSFSMTADGRYVAFESQSSNLVTNDTNVFVNDAFLRDRQTGTTKLLSVNVTATGSANGQSYAPRITPDGRFVAFDSLAKDLVTLPDVTVGFTSDIFVRDLTRGITSIVSTNSAATAAGNNSSFNPALSDDGKFVAFCSRGTDLVTNDLNGFSMDVFYAAPFRSTPVSDFDGDGRTDVSVFRPLNGSWYLTLSGNGQFRAEAFGLSTDRPVPGDFDGDGRTDIAVFRGGAWYILQSSNNALTAQYFGTAGDVPAISDFDDDGKTDMAVFRPTDGTWYVMRSSAGFMARSFGTNGDVPVPADYDGDGLSDVAVYRPGDGTWYIQRSSGGFLGQAFGASGDQPVTGDFDGDGKTDIAVFRQSEGAWYILKSMTGFSAQFFGMSNDAPAQGDYDGDGKTDVAVFRTANGTWYALNSSNGALFASHFGTDGDLPLPSLSHHW